MLFLPKLPEAMEPLWDENAPKYKCCCRNVHVKRATICIGYAQLAVTMLCVAVLGYYYVQATHGNVTADHWLSQYNEKFMSSLMLTVLLQLVIVTMMLHGAQKERRGYLLPFIVFATIGVFLGFLQLMYEVTRLYKQANGEAFVNGQYSDGSYQFLTHLFIVMVHAWCVGVVWRLYTFLGDKKIATRIGAQLRDTQAAFQYGDIPHGYMGLPDPPPYADTVISDKHPLTASLS